MSLQKQKINCQDHATCICDIFLKLHSIYSSKNRFQQSYLPWKGSVWNMKMINIYIALRGKLIFIQIFSPSNKYWCLNTVPAILRHEEKIQYKSLHSAAPHITSIKINHNICLFLYQFCTISGTVCGWICDNFLCKVCFSPPNTSWAGLQCI